MHLYLQLLKHLYIAVRHANESDVESLLKMGVDANNILPGTETTPKQEAKRKKHYTILKKINEYCPRKRNLKFHQQEIAALEDIKYLFEVSSYSYTKYRELLYA